VTVQPSRNPRRNVLSRQRGVKAQRRGNSHTENTIIFEQTRSENPYRHQKNRPINLIPRTRNQEKLVLALQDESQHIVMAVGPAGTGKTYVGMLAAIKCLKEGAVEKIILTRPAVGVDEETHGFLPGTLNEKMQPWLIPLMDVLHEYYTVRDVERMLDEGIIEIAPLAYMRGRSLKGAFVIADECQNTSVNQMKMLLTRLAEGSRLFVTGDLNQMDKKFHHDNGLGDFITRLSKRPSDNITHVEFTVRDVQRHPTVTDVLKLYGDA
jgi:phosphate starvation-inducible PhoH-like protein